MAVLTTWVASQKLASEAHARAHLSPPFDAAGMQLILGVLRLNKYQEYQWKAILATRVVAQRKTKEIATLSLKEWTAEKCLRKLKSFDQSLWVGGGAQQEGGEKAHEQLGDGKQQHSENDGLQSTRNLEHVFLGGSESSHIPRKTQTPGGFNKLDDFDWGEADEAEEEENISGSEDVLHQNLRRSSFSSSTYPLTLSLRPGTAQDEDGEINYEDLAEIVMREPRLGRWIIRSKDIQAAQDASLERLKLERCTYANEFDRLTALVKQRDEDLRLVRNELQKDARVMNGVADALASMSSEYNAPLPLFCNVLILTLTNRLKDRDIEDSVRELVAQLAQLPPLVETVEQLRSENEVLQETNMTQAASLLDLHQKYSRAAQNADLDMRSTQLQEQQQQLLELSGDLLGCAKNIARLARTWWGEVWGKGTNVLEAIVKLQGYYNNPFSAVFASYVGGEAHTASSSHAQDLQKEQMERLIQVTRGTSCHLP